jgi:hypothetical protein
VNQIKASGAPSGQCGMSGRGARGVRAGPIDPSPVGTACGAGSNSPFGCEHVDDVKPAAAAWVGGPCQPRAAVVFDLDTNVSAGAAFDADGEGSARPAGVARRLA